jgi:hypothetical protein
MDIKQHSNKYLTKTNKTNTMNRLIKSKIEYRSLDNPNKIIRAWNKTKASKKLKKDLSLIREVKINN